MKIIIIGAGFAGACVARMLRESRAARITLLEQGDVPGGMLRTHYTANGLPYEYGPRVVSVFRGTPDILPFLDGLLNLEERDIYQGTRLRPDFPVIPFPVDRDSLLKLPCGEQIEREWAAITRAGGPPGERNLRDYLETSVGPTLTELAFEGFNRKFWGRSLEEMPAQWGKLRRLERIAAVGEYRLPSVAPHYYPVGGFNSLFDLMLASFDVRYNAKVSRVDSDENGATVHTDAGEFTADLVITTAPIDALLDFRHGPLEWRGYRIEIEVVEGSDRPALGTAPDGVPFAWLYTPWSETPVCRTTDFGVIHHGHGAGVDEQPSVLLREIVDDSVPMYPVWWQDEEFYRYLADVTLLGPIIPLGRLGLYKYTTMDSTFAMARRLVQSIDRYREAKPKERFEILRNVRGDWDN
ncbi:MAG: FAD-dependent oxidoreductase [Gemmatimonadota bacterium]|nr:FAD-dependent oxidoreductase [Gemmatimonadota bacterium]